MNRIARSALALVVTVTLTFAGAGSASAAGFLTYGKATKVQGGGIGCCPGAV